MQRVSKGICVNCELPILADETAAIGPKGTSHLTYKGCLKAMRSAFAESEKMKKNWEEIAGKYEDRYFSEKARADSLQGELTGGKELISHLRCGADGIPYEKTCDCSLCEAIRRYEEGKR